MIPQDPDWPAHFRCTGFWHLPEPPFEPSPALRAFVDSGDPPVVISFGSMYGVDAAQLTRVIVEALHGTGLRAVLQAGWAELGHGELPDHIMRTEFVPHDWLFQRAAAIVHHGGAGTCAAALRAGKPQLTAFHVSDQQFWSRRMLRLGVSAGACANTRISARWLRAGLRRVTTSAGLAQRASRLREELAGEHGVAEAVKAIERLSLR